MSYVDQSLNWCKSVETVLELPKEAKAGDAVYVSEDGDSAVYIYDGKTWLKMAGVDFADKLAIWGTKDIGEIKI